MSVLVKSLSLLNCHGYMMVCFRLSLPDTKVKLRAFEVFCQAVPGRDCHYCHFMEESDFVVL